MTTLGEVMSRMRVAFAAAGVEDPMAEARIIIGGLLGLDRTAFITRGEDQLSEDDVARIEDAMRRRVQGEPPHRILGHRQFYGLDLALSVDTLEPRPDTEILVDTVLDLIKPRCDEALEILDLGTGTGAICLALLSVLANARGTATDLVEGALETAVANAADNGLGSRFTAIRSNWFESITGTFDVIASNPPYIETAVIADLDREVREHDPMLALDGGADGLDAYRAIAANAPGFLRPEGIIAVETGYDQRDTVGEIFDRAGFLRLRAVKDYAGNDRVQAFRLKI